MYFEGICFFDNADGSDIRCEGKKGVKDDSNSFHLYNLEG